MLKRGDKSRLIIIGCLLLSGLTFVSGHTRAPGSAEIAKFETRCGWFSNPTPANAWLHDRDAQWTIGIQGGYQAEGDWPDFGPKQWIETNVHYGYGCACLRLRVDRSTHRVIEIESAKARPLSACRSDRKLRRWGFK
jgi:hypothetical protein